MTKGFGDGKKMVTMFGTQFGPNPKSNKKFKILKHNIVTTVWLLKMVSREDFHRFIQIMLLMYISIWLLNIWIFAFLTMWHSFCGSCLACTNIWCSCKNILWIVRQSHESWVVIRRYLIRRTCHNYDLIQHILFLLKYNFELSFRIILQLW